MPASSDRNYCFDESDELTPIEPEETTALANDHTDSSNSEKMFDDDDDQL